MYNLRFTILRTDKEWDALERIIQKKNTGKKLSTRGKGFNNFVGAEIMKYYSKNGDGCNGEEKSRRVKKCFSIQLDEVIVKKIKCHAKALGVQPCTLISKIILDPHLLEK